MRSLTLLLLSISSLFFSSQLMASGNSSDIAAKPAAVKLYQFKNVNAQLGLVDKKKNIIIEAQYDYISKFVEGRAYYKLNGKYGFLNEYGQQITEAVYSEVSDFSEGFARVANKDGYGFIDKKGEEIVPTKFAWVSDFYGAAAEVETFNGLTYMIYTPEHDNYYE